MVALLKSPAFSGGQSLKAIEDKAALVSNYKRVRECDLLIYDNTPTPRPDLNAY